MACETELILQRLDEIKTELDYIKDRLVDADLVLTQDDIESLRAAEKDFKERKTKRL